MLAPCAQTVPLKRVPAHVVIQRPRHGRYEVAPSLQAGDQVTVTPPGRLSFAYGGNTYHVTHGRFALGCPEVLLASASANGDAPPGRVLAVELSSGAVNVTAGATGGQASHALVLTPEMLARATAPATRFTVSRDPRAARTEAAARGATGETGSTGAPIVAASAHDEVLQVTAQPTYTAIADAHGLRLDVWPFAISPLQRAPTQAEALPAFWADGLPCSVGCTPAGVTPGWPLEPFHQQHAIRAGINELRPANFHVAVDIEAENSQKVYALQSGTATIRYPGTPDVNVDVGDFDYWHINPLVQDGEPVTAYQTVLGTVLYGFYHVALSQLGPGGDYLNPLRPGGSLEPYTDTEPPVIGAPEVFADGRVIVGAFDPQSFVAKARYETPVLAPSSLAWRLYDARGNALTPLQWAMRGSQNYPPSLKSTIFAPGAANPGFACFFSQTRCVPNWVYWLAGGLTEPLPVATLPPGRYRLAVYAWDWAGNTSARDDWITLPLAATTRPEFGPLAPAWDDP